jgi:hypothetical protein
MHLVQLSVRLFLIGGGMGLGGWIAQEIATMVRVKSLKLLPVVLGWIILMGGFGGFAGYWLGKKIGDSPKITPITEC